MKVVSISAGDALPASIGSPSGAISAVRPEMLGPLSSLDCGRLHKIPETWCWLAVLGPRGARSRQGFLNKLRTCDAVLSVFPDDLRRV